MNWFWQRFCSTSRGAVRSRRERPRPQVEYLEDRRLLSRGLPNVTYHGGPLLQNVQIESVFYGQPWTADSTLEQLISQVDGFLQYFPTSPYMNVLKQYNVGDGSFLNDLVISQNPSGQTLDDSQIRQVLNAEIASGQLATPAANSLYVFFTAPGVVVTDNGQNSTTDFAGYHDTFTDSAGTPVFYAVVPYPTGGVANAQLTDFQQMTVVLSHEVSEAMTDPDTQTGWYDTSTGEEIADIAEGQIGTLDGYVIQGVWSQDQQQFVIPTDTTNSTVQVNGVPVAATVGQELTSLVATLTGAASGTTASSLTATIDWGNGVTSAGTITVDSNGGFDISGSNTYTQAGSFPITVTVRNQSGAVVGSALTSATVASAATTATLVAQGTELSATSGQQFSGLVATFTDSNPNATTANLAATINWGDGTTSTGTISANSNGAFTVSGTHTYTIAGQSAQGWPSDGGGSYGSVQDVLGNQYFVVTVTIHDTSANAGAVALSLTKVAASAPAIATTGQNISAVAGQSFSGLVATFTDTNTAATASSFTATINWGDGTTSTGTVTADPNGGFDVTGTHTYTSSNDWYTFPDGWGIHFGSGNRHNLVSVTITDTQTQSQGKAESLATVAAAAPNLVVTAQNVQATSGQSLSGVIATFTDVNTSATASSFTATIDWGDGTTSTGTVTADPKGGFDLSGTHTYALANLESDYNDAANLFLITVTVKSTTTSDRGSAVALAKVSPASADVQASGTVFSAVFNQSFSGTVATFTPANSNAGSSNYSATIDWGDGTTTTGVIVADPNGGFDVTGSHTYSSLGAGDGSSDWGSFHGMGMGSGAKAFFVGVTIQNTANNGIAEAVSLASVTPKPPNIVASAANLSLTPGTAFSGAVASFTDSDSNGTSEFQAVIAWGDGTASAGTVSANGSGGFTVSGTHTYAAEGNYRILVRIRDADGNSAISLGAAAVGTSSMTSSLSSVALAFLDSAEYEGDLILQDYQNLLGRTPSAAEVAGWVNVMQAGATDTQVLADFLSSQEYFNRAGDTGQSWVEALYRDVLNRNADSAGEATWVQVLSNGVSMGTVALDFATSQERESLVVQHDYQQYLGRSASALEVAGWVTAMQHGATSTQIVTGFLASLEYYQTHNANAGDWLTGVYQNVLARQPDQAGYDAWLSVLNG
jgi:hypothetical protein